MAIGCGGGGTKPDTPPATPAPTVATPPTQPTSAATEATGADAGDDQVTALVKEGKVKFALGDFQGSVEAMRAALVLSPDDREIQLYISRAEEELARSAVEAAPPVEPAQPEVTEQDRAKGTGQLLVEADALAKQEKFARPPGDNALEKYLAVLERDPLNREARAKIAEAIDACKQIAQSHMEMGSYVKALEYLAQAQAMAPRDADIKALVQKAQQGLSGSAPAAVPEPPPPPGAAPPVAVATTKPPPAAPTPSATPPTRIETKLPPPVNGRRPALLRQKSAAVYPAAAWAKGVEGDVNLKLLVGADGTVSDVQVVSSSGVIDLDQAAVTAARAYLFEPALQNDRPIPQWVTVVVTFRKPK